MPLQLREKLLEKLVYSSKNKNILGINLIKDVKELILRHSREQWNSEANIYFLTPNGHFRDHCFVSIGVAKPSFPMCGSEGWQTLSVQVNLSVNVSDNTWRKCPPQLSPSAFFTAWRLLSYRDCSCQGQLNLLPCLAVYNNSVSLFTCM